MKKRPLFTIMPLMVLTDGVQIVLLTLSALYCIVVLSLSVALRRPRRCISKEQPLVSVIVAARNEAKNIDQLLSCLTTQDYPAFEIVIVDDRSTDGTKERVLLWQARDQRVGLLPVTELPLQLPSKKNALARGILASSGVILCFTDADCLPPPQWLSTMVMGFEEKVGLVAGYSPFLSAASSGQDLSGILNAFVRYEEFKGAAWAAASIRLRRGWLCTGRSLAYRRRVYDEVGGFEDIKMSVSGDDDLFLQLVRRKTDWEISYITDPKSFVPTYPPTSWSEFVQQRIRHFSAGKFFPPPMKAFFLSFHSVNLLLLLSLVNAMLSGGTISNYLPFLFKCLADAFFFFAAAPLFGHLSFALTFLLHEIAYVFYNTFIGPLGFIANFNWKPEVK